MPSQPLSWQDRPALIEHLFPVQKISAESFNEQEGRQSKTLTPLGGYWKGRKPLILNKACVLGCLLPVTDNHLKDLEIFEMLMGMDSESMQKRIEANLPVSRQHESGEWLVCSYNEQVQKAKRPEELSDSLFSHVWTKVNEHLGTSASSFPELVEQMGIARFGHRPRVADVFCGSGKIPFEAARLGYDVYASDLNPIACMLTWGAFNIVGASAEKRTEIEQAQQQLADKVQKEIDELGVESDGKGWRIKALLYCVEVICPEIGWRVPLIPSLIISKGYKVIARLIPQPDKKRYEIEIKYVQTDEEVEAAKVGTVQKGDMVHSPYGVRVYRTKISTIRGDYKEGKENKNHLRLWEKSDFIPHPDDIFQERLYCIQWMRKKFEGRGDEFNFRSVTADDLAREQKVIDYVGKHLEEWQEKGSIPDMVIEKGYNTDQPIRERGWTHWHHLFNPRQLLVNGLYNKKSLFPFQKLFLAQALNWNSKLCRWLNAVGLDAVNNVFDNQALNTVYNNGTRSSTYLANQILQKQKSFPLLKQLTNFVDSNPAHDLQTQNDIYITDPPYGDAVKYEEITEFFIAWLRKNPPPEFANWTWDSRRSIAIKGESEDFRQGMIAAYSKMAELMPENGIQVLMFTHQSGSIWSDMTNIIWASGLQVTAAWYVVTETDSALRQGRGKCYWNYYACS